MVVQDVALLLKSTLAAPPNELPPWQELPEKVQLLTILLQFDAQALKNTLNAPPYVDGCSSSITAVGAAKVTLLLTKTQPDTYVRLFITVGDGDDDDDDDDDDGDDDDSEVVPLL